MKKDSPRNHLEKNSKPQVTASEQNKSIILSINEWNFNFQHHISREMGKNELNAQNYSFQKYCSSAFSLSNRWERDKCIEKGHEEYSNPISMEIDVKCCNCSMNRMKKIIEISQGDSILDD